MDWQAMVAFSIIFHLTALGMAELSDWRRKAKTDQILRDLRDLSQDLDNIKMRRIK